MGWIMVLIIWLAAPFAELGIIAALLASNERYKKRVRQLEGEKLRHMAALGTSGGSQPHPVRWDGHEIPAEPVQRQMEARSETVSVPASASAQQQIRPERPAGQDAGDVSVFRAGSAGAYAGLGTAALITGMVFVVLAGLIFATTTWHVLPDICKTFLVLVCGLLFFSASFAADRFFRVRKTGSAFYILGSIFLFLSVLAAAYFKLLGSGFILEGTNRWKVLWVGSMVALGAFWAGLKRFNDRIYTQSCLWGMTLCLFFMAKAFSVTWSGFVCIMMVYSAVLIAIKEQWAGSEDADTGGLKTLLLEGFLPFAAIHFWVFGAVAALGSLTPIWRMAAEGWMGIANPVLDSLPMFSFTASGAASMAALAAGICVMNRKEEREIYRNLRFAALAGSVLYGAGWACRDFICRMAVVNTAFFAAAAAGYLRKGNCRGLRTLPMDICGCTAALSSIIGFYSAKSGSVEGLCLTAAASAGYYLWFYLGRRQWPHLLIALAFLPFPFMTEIRLHLSAGEIQVWTAGVLLATGVGARCLCPAARRDDRVQGQWRVDWHHIISVWTILWMAAAGDDVWRFCYTLLAALYFAQFWTMDAFGKPALFLSSCCGAAAIWLQPFATWPQVLELEMNLLPAAWLLWTTGLIWKELPWIGAIQRAGYGMCLVLLCGDAVFTGDVRDTLILEGLCLAVFIRAQVKKDVWWVRISGGILLSAALFMTRSFWLSISWWVYLLAAGIGLIVFAGVLERRRR